MAAARSRPSRSRPAWSLVLRALREARGLTQDGWALSLAVSTATAGRWEAGAAVPNERAESALITLCVEHGLFRTYPSGPLAGAFTADRLRALLAEARLELGNAEPAKRRTAREDTEGAAPHPERGAAGATDGAGFRVSAESLRLLPGVIEQPLTRCIDREQETELLERWLGEQRLVTITGPGGCGKTRLALHVAGRLAGRFRDGATFIDLSQVQEPEQVAAVIAHTLGLRELPGQSPLDALKLALGDARRLLVLDNCEQALAAAPTIAGLLRACPGLVALATSRAPLHLAGEQELPLEPLALPMAIGHTTAMGSAPPTTDAPHLDIAPDAIPAIIAAPAITLFVERARAVNPAFALDAANAGDVVALCRALDGLPLAIELAAARMKMLPAAALRGRLTGTGSPDLALISGGPADLPHRHRALRTAMECSYQLLSSAEQRCFAVLAVFRGSFSLEIAEKVCAGLVSEAPPILDLLTSLVDQSMVARRGEVQGEPRFGLLETVRAYAAEKLRELGLEAKARAAHLNCFARHTTPLFMELLGPKQVEIMERLEHDLDNIRAALAFSLAEPQYSSQGLGIAAALGRFWWRGHLVEGCDWLARLLDGDRAAGPLRPLALLSAAQLGIYARPAAAAHWLEECVRLGEPMGLTTITATAKVMRAATLAYQGERELPARLAAEALAEARALGQDAVLWSVLYWYGSWAAIAGERETAVAAWEEQAAALRATGDRVLVAAPLGRLGDMALLGRDYAAARRYCEESAELWRQSGDNAGAAQSLASLGYVELAGEHYDAALHRFRHSLAAARRSGSLIAMSIAVRGLAATFAQRDGAGERALALLRAVEAIDARIAPTVATRLRDEFAASPGALHAQFAASPSGVAVTQPSMSLDEAVALALGEGFDEQSTPPS